MKKIALLISSAFMLLAVQTASAADAPWQADFRKADMNDSGGLSLVELDKSKSALLKPIKENFKTIDADGDGQVTTAEYERYLAKADDVFEAQFKKADLNDSGGLSLVELDKTSAADLKPIREHFKEIDSDGDGHVTAAEYEHYLHGKEVPAASVSDTCKDAKHCGVVVDVDRYKSKGEGGMTGKIAGGVAGGVLGKNAVGGTLATVGGAAAGAYVGNEIQKHMSSKDMVKVTVSFDDGSQRSFHIEGEKSPFRKGDRVVAQKGHLKHVK